MEEDSVQELLNDQQLQFVYFGDGNTWGMTVMHLQKFNLKQHLSTFNLSSGVILDLTQLCLMTTAV